MSRRQVIVLGASSQIGVFVIPMLVATGMDVIAVSRAPKPSWYPDFDAVNWVNSAQECHGSRSAASCLLSAGPLSLAADWVDQFPSIKRTVALSTTSVLSKSGSPDAKERAQMQAIAHAEKQLDGICSDSGSELCVLRPTLVYGCGMDQNLSRLAHWIERFGFLPLPASAGGLRQPLHAEDLARTALSGLTAPAAAGLESAICGGSTLEYREMVERIFVALGKPVKIVRAPAVVLSGIASIGGKLSPRSGLGPGMVHRIARNLVFDDTPARVALGHAPRKFQPTGADFMQADANYLRRLASPQQGQDANAPNHDFMRV